MAFLNHMNLFNNFAFSVPSQNNWSDIYTLFLPVDLRTRN
jgi:hypothetical protein